MYTIMPLLSICELEDGSKITMVTPSETIKECSKLRFISGVFEVYGKDEEIPEAKTNLNEK